MSELIKKVNSQPGSPFPASSRPFYSPLAKTSKSALRKIAPLHPTRRTPPPPLPRPPPPKKTKKQKEEEEQADIYRWWEQQNQDNTVKWTTLEHSGVIFPPPYEPLPQDVKMKYNGTLPPCVLRLFFDSSQANPSTYPSRPRRSPASMLHS